MDEYPVLHRRSRHRDTYFKYIQRLGDLGAYTGVYTPTPYAGCTNCTFGELNLVTRGNMAIETVAGIGLDPANDADVQRHNRTQLHFDSRWTDYRAVRLLPSGQGVWRGDDIAYAQFVLTDSAGAWHCYGDWVAEWSMAL